MFCAEISSGSQVKILDINSEKERVSLGIKQLVNDPFESQTKNLEKGQNVKVFVDVADNDGIKVSLEKDGMSIGYIKKQELNIDKNTNHLDKFKKGDEIEALITHLNKNNRTVSLSIKALAVKEERESIAKFSSSDDSSNNSLGDVLEKAMEKAKK